MSGYNLDHISQIGRPALIECDLAIWPLTSILDLDASKPSTLAMLGLCGPFSMVPAVPSGVIKPGWFWSPIEFNDCPIEMPILIDGPAGCMFDDTDFLEMPAIKRGFSLSSNNPGPLFCDGSCSSNKTVCVCVFTYAAMSQN